MLAIEAISFRNQPVDGVLRATFNEGGGSIGRGSNSTLALPDPDRHISRTQATIAYQAGGFVITDTGTLNPVVLNKRPLGNGVQARLKDGDEIAVGGYVLRVSLQQKAEATPFARAAAPAQSLAGAPKDDPLAMLAGDQNAVDPFGDLLSPAPPAPAANQSKPSRAAAEPQGQSLIPHDFDPFGTAPEPMRERGSDPLGIGASADPAVSISSDKSIDEMFGLNAGSRVEPFMGGGPLADSAVPQAGGAGVDPLDDIVRAAAKSQPSASDHVLEIHAHYAPPPPLRNDNAAPQPAQPQRNDGAKPRVARKPVVSWDKPLVHASDATDPPHRPAAPPPPPTIQPKAAAPATPAQRRDAASVAELSSGSQAALLQAFMRGAGVNDVQFPNGLTPELMEVLGKLLRESVQGTLDLLAARKKIKTEIRAAATMIIPRDNNPLKFSPSVEVALSHLLEPKGQGFMSPLRALRDAYNDLRAHQFAVFAGIKAALAGVLARFEPHRLEAQLKQKSLLDNVLPANRKAKQWDLFTELYEQISSDAEEDFEMVFNKEFRRAYDAQMAHFSAGDDGQARRG